MHNLETNVTWKLGTTAVVGLKKVHRDSELQNPPPRTLWLAARCHRRRLPLSGGLCSGSSSGGAQPRRPPSACHGDLPDSEIQQHPPRHLRFRRVL
jgi:hypothetical protein